MDDWVCQAWQNFLPYNVPILLTRLPASQSNYSEGQKWLHHHHEITDVAKFKDFWIFRLFKKHEQEVLYYIKLMKLKLWSKCHNVWFFKRLQILLVTLGHVEIKVSHSDHMTIWQSFWQNGNFDWPAVLRTKLRVSLSMLWLAILFVLIASELLRNNRLKNHAKSKFLATSVHEMQHRVKKTKNIL